MTLETAYQIVKQYDAIVKVRGKKYADQHYLAKGTRRYEKNKAILDEARQVIEKSQEVKQHNGQTEAT